MGGQGGCEQRFEVFCINAKKSGGVGSGVVRVNKNEECKSFCDGGRIGGPGG